MANVKMKVKPATAAYPAGEWHSDGKVKLIATKLTRRQVIRVEKAIHEAISNDE